MLKTTAPTYLYQCKQHFRNFLKELSEKGRPRTKLSELDPHQTADELFGHLHEGDKIAIISRFNEEEAKPYIDALTADPRGLRVRFLSGQSGTEDFCFLASAQKEMVGSIYSTYLFWAGALSNATRVLGYAVDSFAFRVNRKAHYNFTHPLLSSRMEFKVIEANNAEPMK